MQTIKRAWMTGVVLVSVLTGCLGEGSEPSPLPTQVNAIDLVLTRGEGAAAMLVRVTGAPIDSVIGVGAVAGLIANDRGAGIADLAIAGDDIANGVVARIFLAEPRSPADIRVTVTDVVGGELLEKVDPSSQSLTLKTPSTAALRSGSGAPAASLRQAPPSGPRPPVGGAQKTGGLPRE